MGLARRVSERRGLRLSSEQSEHDPDAHEPREVDHAFSKHFRKTWGTPTILNTCLHTMRNGPTGPWSLIGHIKAVVPWQELSYRPSDPPEALKIALQSFNRGIGVRRIYYAWNRIYKWLKNWHERRVQRYLVDIGINQLGESPQRGLLKYTFDQR